MCNCKVPIKCLDIVLGLIETVSVEDLGDLVEGDSSCLVNAEVDLEEVEVVGGDDDFSLPVLEGSVIAFFVDGDS